jgi:hypothetical protein
MNEQVKGNVVSEDELKKQLEASRMKRAADCETAIGEVLAKYKCVLVPSVTFSTAGTGFNISVKAEE